ncbi:MAG: ribosomal-processing cysteine protease Prp [Oscillospiraceae bacterium]
MIIAEFEKSAENFVGFNISGHADYADYGKDIVCAAVSSALQMVTNGLTEILKLKCKIKEDENNIALKIMANNKADNLKSGYAFIESFYLHLKLLAKTYKRTIKVIILEV